MANTTWWGSGEPTADPFSEFDSTRYTGFGYREPSPAAQSSQNTSQNMSTADWMDAARFIYGVYNSRNPPKPKFEATPLSPEQQQLHQLYLQSLMSPATKDNTAIVNNLVMQQLQGLSGMKWQSPRTFGGDIGYGGSNLSYTMPAPSQWPTNTTPLPSSPPRPEFGNTWQDTRDAVRDEWMKPTGSGGGIGNPYGFMNPPNEWNGYAGLGTDPSGGTDRTGFWGWLTNKVGGAIPPDEEGRERWAARAMSVAGAALGLALPATILDKGWDGLQWIYRQFVDPPQPLPAPTKSFEDIARQAPGTNPEKVDPKKPTPPQPIKEDPPSLIDERQQQYNRDWWRNLRSGPGQPVGGGGGAARVYDPGTGYMTPLF